MYQTEIFDITQVQGNIASLEMNNVSMHSGRQLHMSGKLTNMPTLF